VFWKHRQQGAIHKENIDNVQQLEHLYQLKQPYFHENKNYSGQSKINMRKIAVKKCYSDPNLLPPLILHDAHAYAPYKLHFICGLRVSY